MNKELCGMDKEKQIEEIFEDLIDAPVGGVKEDFTIATMKDKYTDAFIRTIASHLASKNYCKQSERVIELPCNLNAEIWYIDKNYTIQKAEVSSIVIKASSRHILAVRYVWETEETIKLALRFEDLNIDYWLTEEEAENALAKRKRSAE